MAHLAEAKTGNPDATFADLAKRRGNPNLHLVATNLPTRLSQVYSKDHSPALPVAEAVRRSISIPLFFVAVRESDDLFVDGGVLNNYPIRLFDREKYVANCDRKRHTAKPPHYAGANRERRGNTSPYVYNRETLGFRLDRRTEIALFRDGAAPKREKIDDFFDYGWARKPAATCRAETRIAPCTSTRSASAPPTSISTPKPRPNSRPPAKPAPSDTSNGTTQQRPTTAHSTAHRPKCAQLKNSVPLGQVAARMRTDLKTRAGIVRVPGDRGMRG